MCRAVRVRVLEMSSRMMCRFNRRQTGIAGSDGRRVDTNDRAIRNAACAQDWIGEVGSAQQAQRCRLRRASDEHDDTISIAASRCNSGYDVRNVLRNRVTATTRCWRERSHTVQQASRATVIGGDVVEDVMVEVPGGVIAENSSDDDRGIFRRAEFQLVAYGAAE